MASSASNLTLQERALLDDSCVLSLTGEFDLFTAPQVRTRLEELTEEGPSRVIVDLSAVTFMDSSGLAVLLDTWHSFGARQRVFRVVCPPGPVRTTLEITGLDEALPLYLTRDEALSL
jgi:anti-sigma B factor antagonist